VRDPSVRAGLTFPLGMTMLNIFPDYNATGSNHHATAR
jgi:hypothetical protein